MARYHFNCANCGSPFIVIASELGPVVVEVEDGPDSAPTTDRERFGAYPGTTPVSFTEHLVVAGSVSGTGLDRPLYQATCSCGWRGRLLAKRSQAQQDGIDHRREALAVLADADDYRRADGAAICDSCRTTYRSHPVEEFPGSTDAPLVLHRLCDGSLVKL